MTSSSACVAGAGMTRSRYRLTRLVSVTADDIAAAKPGDGAACPVAIALNRTLAVGKWWVWRAPWRGHMVGCARMMLGPVPIEFRLTRSVGVFVRDFDDDKPVQPFTFRMYV